MTIFLILTAIITVAGGIAAGWHGVGQLLRGAMNEEQRAKALRGYVSGFAIWLGCCIAFAFQQMSPILLVALLAAITAIYLPSIAILLPSQVNRKT